MGGIGSLLGLLPYAARPAAEVIASHNVASREEKERLRQQKIQEAMLARQTDRDLQTDRHNRAQEDMWNSQGAARNAETFKLAPDGSHLVGRYGTVKPVTGDEQGDPGNDMAPITGDFQRKPWSLSPAPSTTPTPTSTPTPGQVPSGGSSSMFPVAPMEPPRQVAGAAPPQQAVPVPRKPVPMNIGKPPVAKPPARIDPNSQQGITADSTKKVHAAQIAQKYPKPLAPRQPRSAPDVAKARADWVMREINKPGVTPENPKLGKFGEKLAPQFPSREEAIDAKFEEYDRIHGSTPTPGGAPPPSKKPPGTGGNFGDFGKAVPGRQPE